MLLGSTSVLLPISWCASSNNTETLKVKSIKLAGDTDDFKIAPGDNGCTGSKLSPGSCCVVDYEFNPEVIGSLQATSHPVTSPASNFIKLDMLGTGDFAISLAEPSPTPTPSITNDFPLANPTGTSPGSVQIVFRTTVGKSQTVDWKVSLSYTTSGGIVASPVPADALKFKTKSNGSNTQTVTGLGGEMAVSAKCAGITHTATGWVTGILASAGGVPNSCITNQLGTDYDALTCSASSGCPAAYTSYAPNTSNPILLAQVAVQESSYAQFVETTPNPAGHPNWPPYGINAFWPLESPQGLCAPGAYIGLMQVPLPADLGGSMYNAWDWLDNTSAGQAIFQGKLVNAAEEAVMIQTDYTGLAALNSAQLENMALALYSSYAKYGSPYITDQYYVPQCAGTVSGYTCSTGWAGWTPNVPGNPVNPTGNACAVAYVSGGTCTTTTGTTTFTGIRNETLPTPTPGGCP